MAETARLLSMLCLYRKGYDFKRLFTLSEYYDRDRASYYRAIQRVRERDLDLTDWLEYFTFGLQWQLGEVQGKGETLIRLDVLRKKHKLSARQLVALELVQQGATFQMHEFESRCPGVHRPSLQRDLRELVTAAFWKRRAPRTAWFIGRRAGTETRDKLAT